MAQVSEWGLMLLKRFEGCRLEAYRDVAGVWTIGFGHTGDVQPGQVITEAEATELLKADLERISRRVSEITQGLSLTQGQYDALCCFAFNVGTEALRSSTLLVKLKAGDLEGAAREFLRWNHAGGRQVDGLTHRRVAERRLFLGQI